MCQNKLTQNASRDFSDRAENSGFVGSEEASKIAGGALYGSPPSAQPHDKDSRHISRNSFEAIRRAIVQAICIGRPLNLFITIHVEAAGITLCQTFRKKIMAQMAEWLARRTGFPACYVWVCENPPPNADGFGGWHVHLIAHVPMDLRKLFRKRIKRWIKAAGGLRRKGVLKMKPVEHSGLSEEEQLYIRHGIWGLARYLGKGIHPAYGEEFDIAPVFQGSIAGKRAGYSEILGKKHRVHPGLLLGDARRRRQLIRSACPELLGLSEKGKEADAIA